MSPRATNTMILLDEDDDSRLNSSTSSIHTTVQEILGILDDDLPVPVEPEPEEEVPKTLQIRTPKPKRPSFPVNEPRNIRKGGRGSVKAKDENGRTGKVRRESGGKPEGKVTNKHQRHSTGTIHPLAAKEEEDSENINNFKRSKSVPPGKEVLERHQKEKPGRTASSNRHAQYTALNGSDSSGFSVTSLMRRSMSVPPTKETEPASTTEEDPAADDTTPEQPTPSKDRRGRSSNRKMNTSSKQHDSHSHSHSKVKEKKNGRRSHSVPAVEVEEKGVQTTKPSKSSRPSLNEVRGRSSDRKMNDSGGKLQDSSSSGMSPSSGKEKEKKSSSGRRSHSVPEEELPSTDTSTGTQAKPNRPPLKETRSLKEPRGQRPPNGTKLHNQNSSKLQDSHSSGVSQSNNKRSSNRRRSPSVPSNAHKEKEEAETLVDTSKPSKERRGRSSNRNVVSPTEKMHESHSSDMSHSSNNNKKSSRSSPSVPAHPPQQRDDEITQDTNTEAAPPSRKPAEKKSAKHCGDEPESTEKHRHASKSSNGKDKKGHSSNKKLSSSGGKLQDSVSTGVSLSSKNGSRRRSQSVPSQKEDLKQEDVTPEMEKQKHAKDKRRGRSSNRKPSHSTAMLEESYSSGMSLSSKNSKSRRSHSVPSLADCITDEPETELLPVAVKPTAMDKRAASKTRRVPSISRSTALNMFNKSTPSVEPLEDSFREDETRRMVKEAGFLEASEYIGGARSKSLNPNKSKSFSRKHESSGENGIRSKSLNPNKERSVETTEPKVYLPPNPPRNRPSRRWSLTDKIDVDEVQDLFEDDNLSVGKRQTILDSIATPATSRPKLPKTAMHQRRDEQKRSRSHSVKHRHKSQSRSKEQQRNVQEATTPATLPSLLLHDSYDDLDNGDSQQNLLGDMSMSDILPSNPESSDDIVKKRSNDTSLSPFPDSDFTEQDWDDPNLNTSDVGMSNSSGTANASSDRRHKSDSQLDSLEVPGSRTRSPKPGRDKKHKSDSNLHASDAAMPRARSPKQKHRRKRSPGATRAKEERRERRVSPHPEAHHDRRNRDKHAMRDMASSISQRKRHSTESRSKSRSHADRNRVGDALASTRLPTEDEEPTGSMIMPKNDAVIGGASDGNEAEIPKPGTARRASSLTISALYGGQLSQSGDIDHEVESGENVADYLDDTQHVWKNGSLTIQSETGQRVRHNGRRQLEDSRSSLDRSRTMQDSRSSIDSRERLNARDSLKRRESLKNLGRNRLAKERRSRNSSTNHQPAEEDHELAKSDSDFAKRRSRNSSTVHAAEEDHDLAKSDSDFAKNETEHSWEKNQPRGRGNRNPQQRQRSRRYTLGQNMLHQSLTDAPGLEPMAASEQSNPPPTSAGARHSHKEQPWQRRRRLSIGVEEE